MTRIFNRNEFKQRRKHLRNNPTSAERLLWSILKGSKLGGYKFRRQYGVDKYVIDFYCAEKKLAIEADGEIHNSEKSKEYDKERDEYLESFGIKILRFHNEEVDRNLEEIAEKILRTLKELPDRIAWDGE